MVSLEERIADLETRLRKIEATIGLTLLEEKIRKEYAYELKSAITHYKLEFGVARVDVDNHYFLADFTDNRIVTFPPDPRSYIMFCGVTTRYPSGHGLFELTSIREAKRTFFVPEIGLATIIFDPVFLTPRNKVIVARISGEGDVFLLFVCKRIGGFKRGEGYHHLGWEEFLQEEGGLPR